jgi:DNA-binding response OmpR family regulator
VEFHERIFSKFAQADASDTRPNGGTGLGLSIARAIVHKLGGTVDFDRTLSRGSVFYFDLPMWHGSSPTVDKQREPTRVLICEDDPNIAELLSLMLQEIGIESDIAHDIKTARDCLRKQSSNVAKTGDKGAMEHSNTYRALMLDLTLPDGDGVSFIRTLRADETTRELPIIVVSATATDRSGQGDLMGDALNVVDWLEKPIDTARLQHAVRSAAGISTPGAGERPRVLHVEDDPDIVRVACEILKGDADIDSASDLSAARTKLARNMYDLVLLDIALPDGDGMELLAQLKNAARPTPVVVFSARELSREDARRTEAALVKSRTSNETLLQTIQSLISKN